MRLYVEVARSTLRRMTTYRQATAAGIFTNSVFGLILASVLFAVFRNRPPVGGFDAADAVTFTFVAQGLLMVVGIFGTTEMADRIRTGEIATDLCRPYDFQGWWAAVSYGKAAFYLVARGIPPFLVGAVLFHLRLPTHWWIWPAFLLSVMLAVGVSFGFGFIIQLSAFRIVDVRGPSQLGWMIAQFLSGTYLPLVLFPAWLLHVARVLPFAAMVQQPVEVFLGKHQGADLARLYLGQLGWLVGLALVGRWLLARAVRRLVVLGG